MEEDQEMDRAIAAAIYEEIYRVLELIKAERKVCPPGTTFPIKSRPNEIEFGTDIPQMAFHCLVDLEIYLKQLDKDLEKYSHVLPNLKNVVSDDRVPKYEKNIFDLESAASLVDRYEKELS